MRFLDSENKQEHKLNIVWFPPHLGHHLLGQGLKYQHIRQRYASQHRIYSSRDVTLSFAMLSPRVAGRFQKTSSIKRRHEKAVINANPEFDLKMFAEEARKSSKFISILGEPVCHQISLKTSHEKKDYHILSSQSE
ncbi:hypothetical protein ElyMa_005792900 [Elysia marginata]|uniref:Uncharacterized protein n=1 Tax=Elysia marginata TaxID=1093978 RepID=A0AAV4FSL3_9GAST|nr:hypothetical protein ElyMa_005792900 [Elysia marginata]